MNRMNPWVLCILALFLFVGCGDSSSSWKSGNGKAYLHERAFAKDSSLYAEPDQVVVLYLESTSDPGPADEDTGGIGDDVVKIRLEAQKGHQFRLEVPDGDRFTMTVIGPNGKVLAILDKDTPSATVDVEAGIYHIGISHGDGTDTNRALFICHGSTIASKDCPGCELSGIDLRYHNLSKADMTGADLSYANLEYADMTDSVRYGTDMTSAIVTGMKGPFPAPAQNCASGSADCYTVYPAACPFDADGIKGTDYAQLTIAQCDADGTNVSNKSVTIGSKSDVPQTLTLPSGSYWQVTVQNSYDLIPFYTFIKTSATGWTYANGCSSSTPIKAHTACGGSQQLDPTDDTDLRTLCPSQDNGQITFNRIYLLDQQKGNLLFRGPKPCVQNGSEWSFDYTDLMAGLQERFKEQMPSGSVFPDKFKFIDISLINDGSEKGILQAEYVFFGGKSSDNPTPYAAYPSSGTYHPLPSFTVTSTKKTAQVQGQFWWWNIMPLLSGAQTSHVGELADKISTWMKTDNTGGAPRLMSSTFTAPPERIAPAPSPYPTSWTTGRCPPMRPSFTVQPFSSSQAPAGSGAG